MSKLSRNIIWRQRKRLWCGLPWTFTIYSLSEDRLFVETGFFTQREKDTQLYRIVDVSLTRTLIQRLFKLGTVHLVTTDRDLGEFDVKNIRDAFDFKEELEGLVEESRRKNRVYARELMDDEID